MNQLISRTFHATTIEQRVGDGYFNATAMCKAHGKQWSHYWSTATTKTFTNELARSLAIPMDQLIQGITTGPNENRGTWVHPQIAAHLAQWLSPEFAVKVSGWIIDEMASRNRLPSMDVPAILEMAASEIRQGYEERDKLIDVAHDERAKRKESEKQLVISTGRERRLGSAIEKMVEEVARASNHIYGVKKRMEEFLLLMKEGKIPHDQMDDLLSNFNKTDED
mgnify:CR=1 FL=1